MLILGLPIRLCEYSPVTCCHHTYIIVCTFESDE
jgi:hypothetical protein